MAFVYPNPTPILPELHGYSIHKKPTYATNVITMVAGNELQGCQQAFPLWEFELRYERLASETQNVTPYAQNLNLLQYERIVEIFLACGGQYGRFFFNDLSDNSRSGQFIATGDGSLSEFRLVRDWGIGNLRLREPIGGINTGQTINVYLDGVLQSISSWGVSSDLTKIILTAAPGSGVELTMDFYFYYRCRFIDDVANMEQFMYNLWQNSSLKFRSVKD